MSLIKRYAFPELYELIDGVNENRRGHLPNDEILSNCCGANMFGEPSNNYPSDVLEGRCADCKEMASFDV